MSALKRKIWRDDEGLPSVMHSYVKRRMDRKQRGLKQATCSLVTSLLCP